MTARLDTRRCLECGQAKPLTQYAGAGRVCAVCRAVGPPPPWGHGWPPSALAVKVLRALRLAPPNGIGPAALARRLDQPEALVLAVLRYMEGAGSAVRVRPTSYEWQVAPALVQAWERENREAALARALAKAAKRRHRSAVSAGQRARKVRPASDLSSDAAPERRPEPELEDVP